MKKKQQEKPATGLEEISEKSVFLILALLGAVLAYYIVNSPRPYDDDNIGRYFMAQTAFSQPSFFLDVWGRPLCILLFSLPAQIGYVACEIVTAVLSLFTVYWTYRAARAAGLRYAWTALFFVFFQPLFLSTSYSLCAEPIAAFFMALSLFFYYSNKTWQAALVLSFAPLARTELAILLPLFGLVFLKDKKFIAFLLLGTGLLVYQISGMIVKGDPLFLVTASQSFASAYQNGPWDHYFLRYVFIVGPVVLTLMFLQFADEIRSRRINILSISTLLLFAFHVVMYWKGSGIVVGFLRHFVAIVPMVGLLALSGLNVFLQGEMQSRKSGIAAIVISCALTFFYWNFELVGDYYPSKEEEYSKFFIVFGIGILWALRHYLAFDGMRSKNVMVVMVVILCTIFTLSNAKPLKLAPEHQTVKNCYAYFKEHYKDRVPKFVWGHAWFPFFDDFNYYREDLYEAKGYVKMRKENLKDLPLGSIVIWDSHYSWRLSSNVQLQEDLVSNPDFRPVQQFISPDQKFAIYVFEKIKV